jgi:succinate dehydrogenase/fumarate reductase flavoprotein subunit
VPSVEPALEETADVVVVGGGLAGLTAALTLLDRGARVLLIEKSGFVGGNSVWASSGINGVDVELEGNPDSVNAFTEDCEKSSSGGGAGAATGATLETENTDHDKLPLPETVEHIPVLTEGSVETLSWFKQRVGVDLSLVGRLGGHKHARTHRPAQGMAGATLVTATLKACEAYVESGAFVLRKRARAEEVLIGKDGSVSGVRWSLVAKKGKKGKEESDTHNETESDAQPAQHIILSPNVILATGGFANDHGPDSLLKRHAPATTQFATTNTQGSTGDGLKMALKLGAAAVDLGNVQVRP